MTEDAEAGHGTLETALTTGALAGACAGLVLGAGEAAWVAIHTRNLFELGLLTWGPLLMALFCAVPGAALGALARRFGVAPAAAAISTLLLAAGPTVIRYRVLIDYKDVIERDAIGFLPIFGASLVSGVVLAGLGWLFAAHLSRGKLALVSALLAASFVAFGLLASEPNVPRVYDGIREVETANLSRRNAQREARHPDVILIIADTLRADYLSSYDPDSPARTPAIDSLAKQGIRFAHFCAQSSWTKPSFATLISGLHPHTHTAANKTAVLPSEVTTLAESIRDAGYYTLGTSNANPNNASWANFDQGFVEWYDFYPSRAWWGLPWSTTHMIVYERVIEPLMRAFRGHRIHHFYQPADDITHWTLRWLEAWKRPKNVPLFLSLHYMDPHQPHLGGRDEGPKMNRGWVKTAKHLPELETMKSGYAGDIEKMDAALAELFDGLRELGIYEDALVVFTSDHGQELLDHRSWGHGASLYREQLDVPLIVKLPGGVGAGSTADSMARQLDLAPTLLTIAGIDVPETMQGSALLSKRGELRPGAGGDCFASLERENASVEAIHRRGTSYIERVERDAPDAPRREFFDLSRDPAQQENLAGRGDAREAELERALRAELEHIDGTRMQRERRELDAGLEAQLRALGYVE